MKKIYESPQVNVHHVEVACSLAVGSDGVSAYKDTFADEDEECLVKGEESGFDSQSSWDLW